MLENRVTAHIRTCLGPGVLRPRPWQPEASLRKMPAPSGSMRLSSASFSSDSARGPPWLSSRPATVQWPDSVQDQALAKARVWVCLFQQLSLARMCGPLAQSCPPFPAASAAGWLWPPCDVNPTYPSSQSAFQHLRRQRAEPPQTALRKG